MEYLVPRQQDNRVTLSLAFFVLVPWHGGLSVAALEALCVKKWTFTLFCILNFTLPPRLDILLFKGG